MIGQKMVEMHLARIGGSLHAADPYELLNLPVETGSELLVAPDQGGGINWPRLKLLQPPEDAVCAEL
jgi:hypothetical protein